MAQAINAYIATNNSNSVLKGLGQTIVASAQHANINPFLIVAIAHKETSLGDAGDYNVRHGFNSFGRTATSSQPHFVAAKVWYKWTSAKASVDYLAPENTHASGGGDIASYIAQNSAYKAAINSNDFTKLFMAYAPPGENDTTTYIKQVEGWINDLVKLTSHFGASGDGNGGASATEVSAGTTAGAQASVGNASGSIASIAGNGMSPSAQQKFQKILVAAGQKFNVDPNYIASFYYAENSRSGDSTNNADSAQPPPVTGNGKWREPAPPYGNGAPWPTNQYHTMGAFQFIPSTWAGFAVDGNGDGTKDANDLTDEAFGAAKYLASNGGIVGASDSKLHDAAYLYNHSETYVQSVLNTYHYLSSGGQATVAGDTGNCSSSDTSQTTTAGATIDMSTLYDDSTKVGCATGTNDLGTQDGYTNGKKVEIRLCAIPGFKQLNDGLSHFGVNGTDGNIAVNSRVSGAVLALFNAGKQSGITFESNSSFRTMAYQQSLCPCDGVTVAHPGYSNHQMGLAIDFAGSSGGFIGSGDNVFNWLTKNASKFGYKNYPPEPWHWSPTGH